jgi:RNA polymerase sigma factor (sigma-70 family)
MGLSDTRAEDVLQQALLQAWLALGRATEVRDLKPWLYRIVHNTAVNAMRSAGENHGELTDAVHEEAALAASSELDRRVAVREALTDVAALPQMQRQAIFLTAVDGQTHDEVANALGISHGALRGLLYRARATLRSAAAALTPPQLIEWASRGSGSGGPTAERIAELSAGGGAAGISGLLLKGAVVAVTAGAVASGAAVVEHRELGHARQARERTASSPAAGSARGASSAFAVLSAGTSAQRLFVGDPPRGGRSRRHSGAGHGGRGPHTPDGGERRGGSQDVHRGEERPSAGTDAKRLQEDQHAGGASGRTDGSAAPVDGDRGGTAGGSGGQGGGKGSGGSIESAGAGGSGAGSGSDAGGSAQTSPGSAAPVATDEAPVAQSGAVDSEKPDRGRGEQGSGSES